MVVINDRDALTLAIFSLDVIVRTVVSDLKAFLNQSISLRFAGAHVLVAEGDASGISQPAQNGCFVGKFVLATDRAQASAVCYERADVGSEAV